MKKISIKGIVFQIQRFTIHDGPGLRTEVFLKGCPLRCRWCSNPEGQAMGIEPGIYPSKCISQKACGMCEEVCPGKGILRFSRGRIKEVDREMCSNCMACARECPSDAVKSWGAEMSVEECMKEILKDRGYYERSGGGVTVSGGEPLLQSDFVAELFRACRKEGISTCCETTFFTDWKEVEKVLPWTDLFISDIKHMDSAVHRQHTGVPNERILENLQCVTEGGHGLILRIPVIPGFNDQMECMEKTADFILGSLKGRVRTLQLLSFMRLGEEKYRSLDMDYPMKGLRLNRKAFQKRVEGFTAYFNRRGIHCLTGTKERDIL